MAKLIDRFVREDGTLIIRAQHSRAGKCFDVEVKPADSGLAAALWGGSEVPYEISDGRAIFARRDGE